MDISEIDSATIAAYRAAHYTVHAPEQFTLHVGEVSSRLADLMASEKSPCAAFITAWNPFSQVATQAENSAAQQALLGDLVALGVTSFPGFGKDPSGSWPGEESFLVLGLALEQARDLGIKYGQNAILWTGLDACPELVLLR
jgi:hypothetical protein